MNLLAPLNLLWLLPVGGAIVALYMLRLKRRDVTVSSVMLWEMLLQDTQANAPFQKLRRSLLLILQLLIALFLIFTIARPFLWASGLGGQTTALVIDASASMKATDENGGRFAEAIRQARAMVSRKRASDQVVLVLSADRPTLLCALTGDNKRLDAALANARPTDTTGDMREAISFAATLVGSRAGAQVTVISDGAFGHLDDIALGGAKLGFIGVGKRGENVAITAFDVRDTLGGASGRQAFVTVQNFGTQSRKFPLNITVNDRLADAHEIALRPGESHSEVFDNLKQTEAGGVVSAHLDLRDDLAADNDAWVTLPPQRAVKILLVTDGNPFFERVLNTDPRVTLDTVGAASYKSADSANHDMTVWDNAAPPAALPPGRYLFWGDKALPTGPDAPATASGAGAEADKPQILDWNRTHPLMRFVDLANVKLLKARAIAPAPWAQTLAEGESGPLIVAGEKGADLRAIYVSFAALDSDMPLRIAFPIFLSNCVQWLTARPGDSGGVVRPGEIVPLAATGASGPLTVARPDGTTALLPAAAPGVAGQYGATETVGRYHVTGKNFDRTFTVSLLSAAESNIAPVAKPQVVVSDAPDTKKPGAAPTASATIVRREMWPWVAALALAVLCAEWIVYHRRLG